MLKSSAVLTAFVACTCFTIGCASIVGSRAWFEQNQRPDLAPTAKHDLGCDRPIEFKPVHGDDYRDVEASGFGRCGDGCFSGTGDGFHLLAAEITPSADDDYELHLAVRRLPGAKVELHGGFFAAGYEDDDQEDVVVLDMGSLERGATLRWNAGDAPERARVRVFYTGPPGVELAGVRLVRTARVATRLARALDCQGRRTRTPIRRDLYEASRLVWHAMVRNTSMRTEVWKTVVDCLCHNPRSLRAVLKLSLVYLHLGPFSRYAVNVLEQRIASDVSQPQRSDMAREPLPVGPL